MKAFLGLVVLLSFLYFSFEAKSQMKKINDKVLHEKADNIYNDIQALCENKELTMSAIYHTAFFKNAYEYTPKNIRHLNQLKFSQDSNLSNMYSKFLLSEVLDTLIKAKAFNLLKNYSKVEFNAIAFRINHLAYCFSNNNSSNNKTEDASKTLINCVNKINNNEEYLKLRKEIKHDSNYINFFSPKNINQNIIAMASINNTYANELRNLISLRIDRYNLGELMQTDNYIRSLIRFLNEKNFAKIKEKFPTYLVYAKQLKKYQDLDNKFCLNNSYFNYFKLQDGSIKLISKVGVCNHDNKIAKIEIILDGFKLKPMILSFKFIEDKKINYKTLIKNESALSISNYPVPPPPPPLPPGYKPKPWDW